MAKGIKKLLALSLLVTGISMALTACDFSRFLGGENFSSNQGINESTSSSFSIPSDAVLNSITVVNNKDGYERGEELDLTVTANYSDSSTFVITNYQVEGFNSSQIGSQTITVTYEDQTSSLDVFVREPVLVNITATNNKTNYEYGEELDIVVTANYSDGSSVELKNYQISGYNAQMPGEQNVVISYEGQSYTLGVKVNDPILLGISVEGNHQSYEYGEELDIVVTASYSDGSSVRITNYEVEGFDSTNPGQQEVTIKYENKTCSFSTKVNNPVITGISVTNYKEIYEYGEELDIVVTASYSDGTTKEVTGYRVKGFNNKEPGYQTVRVEYDGKDYSFNVTISNPALLSITAVSNKDLYEYADELDVIVYASYSDGSTVEINNYQVTGFNSQEAGEQTLTFKFEGKSCTLKVSVNGKHNRFPADKLNSFLNNEGIKTFVPTPTGYYAWSDKVDLDQDGSNFFYTTTRDEGTVGTDCLADQYAVLLQANGWTVEGSKGEYSAKKANGDVEVSFSTKNGLFSLHVNSYIEFPNKVFTGTAVLNKSSLRDGDKIVLASLIEQFAMTNFENGYFNTEDCNCSESALENIHKNVWRFTLEKSGNYYHILDIHGRKLGTTGLNRLTWDEGCVEWALLFTTKSSIIMSTNSNYGRLCYNKLDGKISTYDKTSADENLIYPQIFKVTETDLIYPTSISLSGKEAINKGKTAKLEVKYYPENSNLGADINWTSSDETVATIDNKGLIKGVSAGKTTITAETVSKDKTLRSSFDVEVKEGMLDEWTIMIYMCGSNLESDDGLASADIEEMLRVSGQPDDVNIIIETGGTTYWHRYNIDASALSRYHIENKELVLDEKLQKANMGRQNTFESFLNWGLDNYPAEKTGVILWNHGGALDGVCFDDSTGSSDSLKNSETSKAFKNVFEAHGIDKLEFVGYDACLMQVQDIAEFNSHYFNYMVGSEETEVGDGWVYSTWIDDVYAGKDTSTILKATCDGFISKNGGDQTLSYLDLSKMSNYFEKFEAMAAAIKSTAKSNYSSFKNILSSVKSFGDYYYTSGLHSYGTIDGYDLLNKLSSNATYSAYTNQINEVKSAYSSLVAYSKKGSKAGQAYGLVVIAGVYISYSTSETSFTNWRSIFK